MSLWIEFYPGDKLRIGEVCYDIDHPWRALAESRGSELILSETFKEITRNVCVGLGKAFHCGALRLVFEESHDETIRRIRTEKNQ